MKHSFPLIALYDEDKLERQLLHNVLERNGYKMAFSCSQTDELFINLKNTPKALLINSNHINKKLSGILKKINGSIVNLK
jgi:hypothetical protein